MSARPPISWRHFWAARCGEPANSAAAQRVDHRAAVQGAVVGGESGVDFGGVATQRRRRTGRGHRFHGQAHILIGVVATPGVKCCWP